MMNNQTILIVDDERAFLLSLKDGLATHQPGLQILTAGDGREAMDILAGQRVDLLVTDLKLPIMDGFQLLAHVTRKFPCLPVIVMTAFGTQEIESRLAKLTTLHYLEKPLDFDELAKTIENSLSDGKRSFIRGITLATFLQLVHMEQKTCTLKVSSTGRSGYLFIDRGTLIDAETDNLNGEQAATEMVAWDNSEIEMDGVCRRRQRVIQSSMEFVVMEAYRLKDERDTRQPPPTSKPLPAAKARDNAPSVNATAMDKLPTMLRKSSAVAEFAIFDRLNFLIQQNPDPSSFAGIDPGWHHETGSQIGELLGFGEQRFTYLQLGTAQRVLMMKRREGNVVLCLNQGAKARQVLSEIASSL